MRLLGDFCNIEDKEEGWGDGENTMLRCRVRFNAGHYIYKVHFPRNPITPGVCVIQTVTEILEQHLQKHLQLATVVSTKFRKAITPDIIPTFVFNKIVTENGHLTVKASVEADGTQYVAMSLMYDVITSAC